MMMVYCYRQSNGTGDFWIFIFLYLLAGRMDVVKGALANGFYLMYSVRLPETEKDNS